ncbi:MATE family efflux transporter [Kurthia sibirica]|uniref:Multidrug export protein MepA n=2 Tax=Kurthia sibirica TaxID=202750 RepID=A0A2U3ALQ5_9BACL|nr:MATE family efflux transporter [Kurthia sibirica]
MSFKLQKTNPRKLFISYLIPSLLGMLLMASNILVDGIFVSHGVGEDALAGINIATPIFSILLAVSLWIGMGGATLFSIALGEGKKKEAQSIFTRSVILTSIIVGVFIIIGLWKLKEIAYLFGASAITYPYVRDYLFVILLFGFVYVLENIISIFIRNDGNPKLAMTGLGITAILNIILNYFFIFVWQWGVTGAAYATALSTVVGLAVLLLHFKRPNSHLKWAKPDFHVKSMLSILQIGLPSYVVEMSFALTVVAYNITFLFFAGTIGVTSYAIINYLHAVFLMIFIAVGASLQPIVSYHFGAKLYDRLRIFLKLGILTAIGIGVMLFIVGLFGKSLILMLFGIQDEAVINYTTKGITLFFVGYLFLGFNLVIAEYFQAIKRIRFSTWIVLTRSILLFMPLLYVLPKFGNSELIWLAFPIAEGLTAMGLIILIIKNPRLHPIPKE